MDKKTVAIFALLALLIIMGAGWFSTRQESTHENIPYDNTYDWTEIFGGYEAYLDRRISYSIVSGDSMEPTFGENDVVLWVEVDPAELKVSDIIIFAHPTRPGHPPMAHRIIEVGQNAEYRFRTQGDNMSEPDQHWVPEENIQGLVIGVIYSMPSE